MKKHKKKLQSEKMTEKTTKEKKNRRIVMKNDTKKKRKLWLKKLFCSSSKPVRKKDTVITHLALKKRVRTKEHENILKLIENETIPSVREAWIDYFLEKTKKI